MKAVLISSAKYECKFPKLMMNRFWGFLVLFHRRGKGIVVSVGNSPHPAHSMGAYQDGWDMDAFENYEGSVTLAN